MASKVDQKSLGNRKSSQGASNEIGINHVISANSKSVEEDRKEGLSPLAGEENGEAGTDEKTKRTQIQSVMQMLSNKVLEDARRHE